jgi:transposase
MVAESKTEFPSEFAAIEAVAGRLGIGSSETLRRWIRRAEIDSGQRPGLTTAESEQVKALKRENAELRRANEILKSASAFFAAELDRPSRF